MVVSLITVFSAWLAAQPQLNKRNDDQDTDENLTNNIALIASTLGGLPTHTNDSTKETINLDQTKLEQDTAEVQEASVVVVTFPHSWKTLLQHGRMPREGDTEIAFMHMTSLRKALPKPLFRELESHTRSCSSGVLVALVQWALETNNTDSEATSGDTTPTSTLVAIDLDAVETMIRPRSKSHKNSPPNMSRGEMWLRRKSFWDTQTPGGALDTSQRQAVSKAITNGMIALQRFTFITPSHEKDTRFAASLVRLGDHDVDDILGACLPPQKKKDQEGGALDTQEPKKVMSTRQENSNTNNAQEETLEDLMMLDSLRWWDAGLDIGADPRERVLAFAVCPIQNEPVDLDLDDNTATGEKKRAANGFGSAVSRHSPVVVSICWLIPFPPQTENSDQPLSKPKLAIMQTCVRLGWWTLSSEKAKADVARAFGSTLRAFCECHDISHVETLPELAPHPSVAHRFSSPEKWWDMFSGISTVVPRKISGANILLSLPV